MFNKILVANRGEIACRVIKTARKLGVKTVAVYSEADQSALHVTLADEARPLGEAPAAKSYLHQEKIIQAALDTGAEAIHPGYGFLAENPQFAERCLENRLIFIGPTPEAMAQMGLKLEARRIMQEAAVPVVPGSATLPAEFAECLEEARKVGFPLMIKASAGGGGIGMEVVREEKSLEKALKSCRARARGNFGDDTLYLERYLPQARHIEVQVLGLGDGQVVHLNERECSLQRRHQKVIEEAPSPFADQRFRERLGEAAVRAAGAILYRNAGTVEFIVDPQGNFYFLEMNTRLQVEHPVTEMTTGLDLVELQLRIAAGETVELQSKEPKGHAIECRLYAEDPKTFYPSPGTIQSLVWPEGEGIRVDAGIISGYTVTPYYDPLLAKIIVWGKDRRKAIECMEQALAATVVEGVKTNLPLLRGICRDERFLEGQLSTTLLDQDPPELVF